MSEALRVTNLSRSFGDVKVLDDINLHLEAGERLITVGHSGSGKTTLLRLIAGLDVPTSGEVVLNGQTASVAGRLILPPERRGVAMVFQGLALFPHLRALDQIAFAARGRAGRKRARVLLDRVGLGHRAAAPLDQLSGGERQRIALARALAQEPGLLLMDEPFASLDDPKRAEMRDLLRGLLDETNATLVLVTHSREDAFDLARRLLVLDHGRGVASGDLREVVQSPENIATVKCLGLGEVIDAVSVGGTRAATAFGEVTLTRAVPSGRVEVLVRRDQWRVLTDGVNVKVAAVNLRLTEAGSPRLTAILVRGGHSVHVDLPGVEVVAGQEITVSITGGCTPLSPSQ